MYCLFIVHIRVQQLLKTCSKLIIELSWLKSYLAIVSQRPAVLFVCLCFFSTLFYSQVESFFKFCLCNWYIIKEIPETKTI